VEPKLYRRAEALRHPKSAPPNLLHTGLAPSKKPRGLKLKIYSSHPEAPAQPGEGFGVDEHTAYFRSTPVQDDTS
jgi:hypothetical protein